jgi:stress response protein SCP2
MLLTVKAGETKQLPKGSTAFTAGMGWDPAVGTTDSPDLDLWIFRHHSTGLVEAICWANQDWHRPDLGVNVNPDTGERNPFIATPELDVVHKGDDRTGAGSATGYDENAVFALDKAPATVVKYSIFGTIYDEKNQGLTLGMASNVKFGVKDEATGHELVTDPATAHSFEVSVALCTLDRAADGSWSMTAVEEAKRGTTDSMFVIAAQLGVK